MISMHEIPGSYAANKVYLTSKYITNITVIDDGQGLQQSLIEITKWNIVQ